MAISTDERLTARECFLPLCSATYPTKLSSVPQMSVLDSHFKHTLECHFVTL